MQSLLLAVATAASNTPTSNKNTAAASASVSADSEGGFFGYIAAGIVAAAGVAYFLMSNSSSTSGARPGGAPPPASSGPTRVSEGAPDPNRAFTLAELKKYDGSNPTSPIYMGCGGLVFDVTSGASFYGPGGPYGCFAGRDASRGLAKMDLKVGEETRIDDLTPSEKSTMREWKEKFETKYPVVGKIVDESQPNSGSVNSNL